MPVQERLINSKLWQTSIKKLKNIYFGKHIRVSLYLILTILLLKLRKDAIQIRAQAVAFNLTLAVFPFMIFLITLIPYIPLENLMDQIFAELEALLQPEIYEGVARTLHDFTNKPREGLLSIGFLTAMFLATNGMQAFIMAFNRSYRVRDKRNLVVQRLIAWMLTIILSVMLIVTVVLIVTGELILSTLLKYEVLNYDPLYYSIDVMRYLVVMGMFFFAISLMYYLAPAVKIKWKTLRLGAMVATLMSLTVSAVFSYYITHFSNYDKLYGSIGAFIGFMVWLFVVSFVILFGFELNVSIQKAKEISKRRMNLNGGELASPSSSS